MSLKSDLVKKLEMIAGLEDRPSKVAGGSPFFTTIKRSPIFITTTKFEF